MAERKPKGKAKAKTRSAKAPDDAAIVDAALARADEIGWDALNLSELAAGLGLTPADLRARFRDQDAIADSWFRRAQDAMLAAPPKGFREMAVRDRLEMLMLRWFDALAPHRQVTAEMLAGKLWYAHPHHYVPMVFNLSRLIQWLRDAAGMRAMGRQRQVEEIGLTLMFLAALRTWCGDDSDGQETTRAFLARRLDQADRAAARVFRAGRLACGFRRRRAAGDNPPIDPIAPVENTV